jgi:hypothetical protein
MDTPKGTNPVRYHQIWMDYLELEFKKEGSDELDTTTTTT